MKVGASHKPPCHLHRGVLRRPPLAPTKGKPQRALQCAGSSFKRLKRTLARQPLASSEIIAIANTFLDKYGGQPHHQSKIGAQVHGFRTKNHEEVLEALLQDTPIIGQALQSKIVKFLKNKRPGAMTAMKAWATRMRYKFRSIPLRAASKFAVALDINVGRGQPQTYVFAAGRHDA